ncbi:sugar transporter SWEET1 isoform X2 [Strongylocentrotus purpuratus]|uniref:Sugar transporter SWEET1 n=1 Tax=Strongylocentrotus purpuratus TaxID=7668 RepID=A0A7M7HQQ8_STRPU|nr:sugar transporter SWEET1 isoform X2 [Strongylocentrotus purpuratus]|eukprot:XP_011684120.1 PREDICTED: sugar transporter SWEET1 isoform X4 [Strongylocentrotus purpuratus]
MDFQSVLSLTATVSTIGLFLTGIQICMKIRSQGNTQNISIFPFIAGIINTVLWTKYGVLIEDQTVIFTNGVGIVLQTLYTLIYYLNTNDKQVHSKLLYTALIIYPTLGAVKFMNMTAATAIHYIGLASSFATVLMYAAPLSVVAQIIRTKSTEALPFPLSFVGLLVSLQWFIYGRLVQDSFIQIPNFLGMLLGAFQMSLFIRYPGPSRKYDLAGSSVI